MGHSAVQLLHRLAPGELCPLQFTGSKDFRLHIHEVPGSILGTSAGTQVPVWRYFGANQNWPLALRISLVAQW